MSPRYPFRAACLAVGSMVLGPMALAPVAYAQPDPVPVVDGRIVPLISGGVLSITVQLRTDTGTDDLGTTTLRIGFNAAALRPVSGAAQGGFLADGADYTYANFDNNTDADYQNATVSYPLPNRIHVNIELNTDNNGTPVAQSPAWTDVVTVRFAITDPAQTSQNVFFAGSQEIYDGDNATLWTPGAFIGADIALPVELAAFTAFVDGDAVRLAWTTASETNNAGFHVEVRGPGDQGRDEASSRTSDLGPRTASAWRSVAFVPGAGTTAEARAYERRVERLSPGRYAFRLRQVDTDGTPAYSNEVEVDVVMAEPVRFTLTGPNPARGRAAFALVVREAQRVVVEAFDALGRRVALLHDGAVESQRSVPLAFDVASLPPGLYVVVARGERVRAVRTLTVVR